MSPYHKYKSPTFGKPPPPLPMPCIRKSHQSHRTFRHVSLPVLTHRVVLEDQQQHWLSWLVFMTKFMVLRTHGAFLERSHSTRIIIACPVRNASAGSSTFFSLFLTATEEAAGQLLPCPPYPNHQSTDRFISHGLNPVESGGSQ